MSKPNKYCKNKEWLYEQYIVQGKSANKIAKEIGCSPSSVQGWLRTHEIPIRDCSSSKLKLSSQCLSNESWLRDQYLVQMKSATKIASEINCQQETVSNFLHKYNIPIRTQSEEIGGERHPLYGKHHSEKSIRKNSESHIGIPLSEEHKKKVSIATSGPNNPRYGVKLSKDQIERQKVSLKMYLKIKAIKLLIVQ